MSNQNIKVILSLRGSMKNLEARMREVDQAWENSPLYRFSYADHMPTLANEIPKSNIFAGEQKKYSAALEFVSFSRDLLGRESLENGLYRDVAGGRYGATRFLAGTRELYLLQKEIEERGVSLDDQSLEIRQAIVEDIEQLRWLGNQHFGTVNPDRFEAIAARAHRDAMQTLASLDTTPEMRSIAGRVLERIPPGRQELVDKHLPLIPQELADHWYPTVAERFDSLISLVEPDTEYSSEELVQLFENALAVLETAWNLPGAVRWGVQLFDGNSINIDPVTETIRVPRGANWASARAIDLIVHEIGVHLVRRFNAERTGSSLLVNGLPGYYDAEEGLADTLGQIASKKLDDKDLVSYDLGIGLATLEPQVPLARLGEVMFDVEVLREGKPFDENKTLKFNRRVHRIIRGMPSFVIDGQLHQLTYNADLKYTRSLPDAVAFLEHHNDNPMAALNWVLGGKFAYNDPKHVRYYQERSGYTLGSR